MNRPAFHLCIVLVTLATSIRATRMVDGAELRSTRGERMIVRQVSTASDATGAMLTAQPLENPVVEPLSIEELQLDSDSYVSEEDLVVEYIPDGPRWNNWLWVETEFLLWWRKGRRFPPLVTRAFPADPDQLETDHTQWDTNNANPLTVLTAPTVFGGGPIGEHGQPGGRLDVGFWLDEYRSFGLGGRFTAVGDASVSFLDASDGSVGIGRPFFETVANQNNAVIVAGGDGPWENGGGMGGPTQANGRIAIGSDSEILAGDLYYRLLMHENSRMRADFVFGYQIGRIDEDLTVDASVNNPAIGQWDHTDTFRAENEYHGGHFGIRGEYRNDRWALELLAKFGFGSMRQTVLVEGVGQFTDLNMPPGVSATSGLLAQTATNGGTHVQDQFAFTEDVRIAIAYWPSSRLKISAGYSLMYWSSVVRPGDHIDFGVDRRLVDFNPANDAAATRPTFSFDPTGFFVHGVNLGVAGRF